MREKIHSYLGFAKRSGNLLAGYNTCIYAMTARKVKLLILTVDLAENTIKKMRAEAEKKKIPYRIYGQSHELSGITGCEGRGIFGVIDEDFAKIIVKEIDKSQSEKKEVFE